MQNTESFYNSKTTYPSGYSYIYLNKYKYKCVHNYKNKNTLVCCINNENETDAWIVFLTRLSNQTPYLFPEPDLSTENAQK